MNYKVLWEKICSIKAIFHLFLDTPRENEAKTLYQTYEFRSLLWTHSVGALTCTKNANTLIGFLKT